MCTLSAFGKSTSRARASALHCGRVICTASRGVAQGGEVQQGAAKGTPLPTPLACHYTCVNRAVHNTVAHTLV